MTVTFKRSPLGFGYLEKGMTYPKAGAITFNGVKEPLATIDSLWNEQQNLITNKTPVHLVARVVACAKEVFGENFYDWAYIQITTNNQVAGYRLGFLLDMLNFIATGRREYNHLTWGVLLQANLDETNETVDVKLARFKDTSIPKTTNELISLWLQRDGGIDMVHTLKTMFGK